MLGPGVDGDVLRRPVLGGIGAVINLDDVVVEKVVVVEIEGMELSDSVDSTMVKLDGLESMIDIDEDKSVSS